MFIGHYGMAIVLKRAEPRLSLFTLTVAALFVDLLWLIFIALGVEQMRIVPGYLAASQFEFVSYPLSHSLVAAVVWAAVVGAIYYSWPTKDTAHHTKRTLILMFLVASHWLLDVAVHAPDLPLAGNDSTKLGLGIWKSIPATLAVEGGIVALGLGLLILWPPKRYQPRSLRLLVLGLVLTALEVVSIYAPPPPSLTAVMMGMVVTAPLLFLLIAWADRPLKTG